MSKSFTHKVISHPQVNAAGEWWWTEEIDGVQISITKSKSYYSLYATGGCTYVWTDKFERMLYYLTLKGSLSNVLRSEAYNLAQKTIKKQKTLDYEMKNPPPPIF